MTIIINSPRGEGYTACCEGKPRNSNPYYVKLLLSALTNYDKWQEWDFGWTQAYNDRKFGSEING